jgi:hypothetical protein
MSLPEAKSGNPPAAMGRLGFLQRLALVAGALGLGILAWPRLARPGVAGPDPAGAGPAPRPAALPAIHPPTHSVKRRG